MPLTIPMVGREGKDHITECYFSMVNLKEINPKKKHHVRYPDVPSTTRPKTYSPDLLVPKPDGNTDNSSDSEHSDKTVEAGDDAYKPEENKPVPLTQAELTDLARDLNLTKESAQLLGSPLKAKYLLSPERIFYWYRKSDKELRQFFIFQSGYTNYPCFLCLTKCLTRVAIKIRVKPWLAEHLVSYCFQPYISR